MAPCLKEKVNPTVVRSVSWRFQHKENPTVVFFLYANNEQKNVDEMENDFLSLAEFE